MCTGSFSSRAQAIRKQREREARAKREFERRMNPHTKEDFELLYHALESKTHHSAVLWACDTNHRV